MLWLSCAKESGSSLYLGQIPGGLYTYSLLPYLPHLQRSLSHLSLLSSSYSLPHPHLHPLTILYPLPPATTHLLDLTGTMLPTIPIDSRGRSPQSYKSDLSAPTPSPDTATGAMAFSLSFGYSELSSPASLPPPPPPSPNDMLDITPRKCSFSNTTPLANNACAFPSWPAGPSLLSGGDVDAVASSFLSDEDLWLPPTPNSDSAIVDPESAAPNPGTDAPGLTTEQQIQMMHEEQHRARFMAQVEAHARAHRATRIAQQAMMEREMAKRAKQRKVRPEVKRRTTPTVAANRGARS